MESSIAGAARSATSPGATGAPGPGGAPGSVAVDVGVGVGVWLGDGLFDGVAVWLGEVVVEGDGVSVVEGLGDGDVTDAGGFGKATTGIFLTAAVMYDVQIDAGKLAPLTRARPPTPFIDSRLFPSGPVRNSTTDVASWGV